MARQSSQKRASHSGAMEHPSIPDRLYFKIGDVAQICEVETYVLRFWETQFPQLKPNKSGTGQRLYRRRDVETALEIKRLVHGAGYTIAGARQALGQGRRAEPERRPVATAEPGPGDKPGNPDAVAAAIGRARAELRELSAMLAAPEPQPPRRRPRMSNLQATSGLLFP